MREVIQYLTDRMLVISGTEGTGVLQCELHLLKIITLLRGG